MVYCLTDLLVFDIRLLYYYININSSITCRFFFWRYISFFWYFYFIFICFWMQFFECNSFECNSFRDFEILAIWSAILLRIKSPVASAVLWIVFFLSSFYCICCRFFSTIKKFITILIAYIFSNFSAWAPIFLANEKNLSPFTYILTLGSIE